MSTSEVFTEFYDELVAILPMDDSRFVAKLFTHKLLPGNLKQRIEAKQTVEDKATYFLDHAIEPGVSVDNSESFCKLLELMGKSGNITLKTLADKIKTALFSTSGHNSLYIIIACLTMTYNHIYSYLTS